MEPLIDSHVQTSMLTLALATFLNVACALGAEPAGPVTTAADSANPAEKVERVAFLPLVGDGQHGDMIGVNIRADALRDAVPLLKADGVTIVVIKLNSGGGGWREVSELHAVLRNDYQRSCRTVVWCEACIQSAFLAFWIVPEWYVTPTGYMGGATCDPPPIVPSWEEMLALADTASHVGGHDPLIARSLFTEDALSADIDDTGRVVLRRDEGGRHVVKPEGRMLSVNAADAVKFGIARGIAATSDELLASMGVKQWVCAGEAATQLLADFAKSQGEADREAHWLWTKVNIAIEAGKTGSADATLKEADRAERFYAQLVKLVAQTPGMSENGPSKEILEALHDQIKALRAPSDAAPPDPPAALAPPKVDRVAILELGPTPGDRPMAGDVIGYHITADLLRDAAALLEKDGVTTVVLRVNSGGGWFDEVPKIHAVLREHYTPNFRTVVWVESAGGSAAFALWVLPEWYVMPHGNIGGWPGGLGMNQAAMAVADPVAVVDGASHEGGRSQLMARSLMTDDPLSADVDKGGAITFRQDLNGRQVINRGGGLFSLSAACSVQNPGATGVEVRANSTA